MLAAAVALVATAGCSTDGGLGLLAGSDQASKNADGTTTAATDQTNQQKPAHSTTAAGAISPTTKATLDRAQQLKSTGKPKEALALLEAASNSEPGNNEIRVQYGFTALEAGDAARARTTLSQTAGTQQADWRVLSALGVAHSSLGDQVEARKALNRALELAPNNPTILNNIGMTYVLEGKLDAASEMLRRAAESREARPIVARNVQIIDALKKSTAEKPSPEPKRAASVPVTERPYALGMGSSQTQPPAEAP
jgi:Flp pilus assembly protein TadD